MRSSPPAGSLPRAAAWIAAVILGARALVGCDASSESRASDDAPATTLDYATLRRTRVAEDQDTPPEYPASVLRLEGQRVALPGYMSPYDDDRNLARFILRPNPVGCFFCAVPSPVEVALVERRVREGERVPFHPGAIEVRGTLRLWTPSSRLAEHEDFPFVLEDALVAPIDPADIPEEILEKHAPGGASPPSGAPDEEEDF